MDIVHARWSKKGGSSEPPRTPPVYGPVLGPLLFNIYINSLANLHLSPGSTAIFYADDILLYRLLVNHHDTAIFQHDVNCISDWITSSGLSINPSKSSLLVISRSRTKPQVLLTINSTPVTIVESAKYLGITITSDLRWNVHISNICKSAKQKLGLIYRNFNQAEQRSLCQLYEALDLPKLDYCSSVWDPPPLSLIS